MAAERWAGARDELDRRAAVRIAAELTRRARGGTPVVLAVVGGRSVGGIFAALQTADVPWERVHVVLADERLVPLDSDESNFKLIDADLIEPLRKSDALPAANVHPLRVDDSRPDRGIAAYREELARLGGALHVAVLSAGEDGHTASLFPRHPSVDDPSDSFILVRDAPKPPPDRMSASRRLLAATALGVIAFYGEGKRDALARFDDPGLGVRDCPSKVVQEMSAAVVLTDLAPAPARG
jgi:6-phosphogluconolactonase